MKSPTPLALLFLLMLFVNLGCSETTKNQTQDPTDKNSPLWTTNAACDRGIPKDLFNYLKKSRNGKMRLVTTAQFDTLKIYYRDADSEGGLTMLVETDIGGDGRNVIDPENPSFYEEYLAAGAIPDAATEECSILDSETLCRHQLDKTVKTELIKCGSTLTLIHGGKCLCKLEIMKECDICIEFGSIDQNTDEVQFRVPRKCMPAISLPCTP